MEQRVRVAIAGCHRMLDRDPSGHNWAAGFAAASRAEIVGVFDLGPDTRQAFVDCWGPIPTFDDYALMLDTLRPDVVCVATRQTMHAEQIEQAVAAGLRGILCDKPLATSMAEVDRIVAVCTANDVKLAFGLNRRWYPTYRSISQFLRDGHIGEVQTITAYGLLNLINHGCHWFDRVLDLAGDPEIAWVSGEVDPLTTDPADSRRHLDPPGTCQIAFTNGVRAFVSSAGSGLGFDIVGTAGRLVVANEGSDLHSWSFDKSAAGAQPAPLPPPAPSTVPPTCLFAADDLIDAITGGGETLANIDVARRATEIGFAVHHSHRDEGRRIAPNAIDRELRIPSFPWGNE